MIRAIYKIKITNWKKYNGKKRQKGYRCVMISENFLCDAKIASQSPVTRLLFLSCLLASSQSDEGQCEVTHESLRSQSGVKSQSIESQLKVLQSLQLLTYEKIPSLYNLSKDKLSKDKLIPKGQAVLKTEPTACNVAAQVAVTETNKVIAHFCERFKDRYGTNPPIKGKAAGIFKRITRDFGEEKSKIYIDGYFSLPDAFVVKRKHPVELIETKLNEITVFINSGKFTTQSEATQMDKTVKTVSQLDRIRSGQL